VPVSWTCFGEKDMTDVMVILGGIVPDDDAERLKPEYGVAAVFQPGASLEEIVKFIQSRVKQAA